MEDFTAKDGEELAKWMKKWMSGGPDYLESFYRSYEEVVVGDLKFRDDLEQYIRRRLREQGRDPDGDTEKTG